MSAHIISGIDIGNSRVKVVIAKIGRDTLRPEIIGVGSAPSNGLRKGTVVDMKETVDNIRAAVQQAEAMAGVKIKRAYLAVNGLHIHTQTSRGVVGVSRADTEISQNDIDRVENTASVVSLPPNREIIHVLPRNFVVDNTELVKNPLGMKGVRLEADVFIIDGLSQHLHKIAKCVNENDIEVVEPVFAPLAAAKAALDKNMKEYGVIHLDFGGGTASLAVFEEAELVHSLILPIGSQHITNDLNIALRANLDIAERVKLEYGSTSEAVDLRTRPNIDLSELLGEEGAVVQKKTLVHVVDARVQELLDLVRNELKKVPRGGILPAGIVLSGGGANLPGFSAAVKEALHLPVKISKPLHIEGILDTAADPAFIVAIGLVLWGAERESGGARPSGGGFAGEKGFFGKAAAWLKNFMP